MSITTIQKLLLWIGGLGGVALGASILIAPVPFYASTGIHLAGNVSMLSELRAIGMVFLACGVMVIVGSLKPAYTRMATLLTAVLYLGCASGRLVGLWVDGRPSSALMVVMSLEFLLGLACIACLIKTRKSLFESSPT